MRLMDCDRSGPAALQAASVALLAPPALNTLRDNAENESVILLVYGTLYRQIGHRKCSVLFEDKCCPPIHSQVDQF